MEEIGNERREQTELCMSDHFSSEHSAGVNTRGIRIPVERVTVQWGDSQ
jgi:hypothetical protein